MYIYCIYMYLCVIDIIFKFKLNGNGSSGVAWCFYSNFSILLLYFLIKNWEHCCYSFFYFLVRIKGMLQNSELLLYSVILLNLLHKYYILYYNISKHSSRTRQTVSNAIEEKSIYICTTYYVVYILNSINNKY